jgi:hypothetical protein
MKKLVFFGTIITVAGIAGLSFKNDGIEISQIESETPVKELPVMKNEAFKRGEMLKFRVHYGIVNAGIATLAVTDETKDLAGRKTLHVVGIGKSLGAFDYFFKVRDRYETYMDEQALVPWLFVSPKVVIHAARIMYLIIIPKK